MKALTAVADLPLEVPRLLVAAAQPYQTMSGPALTTTFAYLPQLLPFQTLPFSNGMVASVYYHTLLHSLAEFAETPRPARHSHVRQLTAPKADFWRSVGTLNTFYHTHYPTPPTAPPRGFADAVVTSSVHPTMGAVELVRASHRKELDVRLTLFNDAHQPVSAMLMTGPSEHIPTVPDTREKQGDTLVRHALPYAPPPGPVSVRGTDVVSPYTVITGPLAATGGLYGDLVTLAGGASWAHRACLWTAEALAAPSMPVPPWLLYQMVVDLTARLYQSAAAGADGVTDTGLEALVPLLGDGSQVQWTLCAQQVVVSDDVVFGEPLELVCAAPRVALDYRLPPWRHLIGQPALRGGSPCVTMRVEVRQRELARLTGSFFIVPTRHSASGPSPTE